MSTSDEIGYYAADSGGKVLITMQDLVQKAAYLLDTGELAGCVVGAYRDFAGRPGMIPGLETPDFLLDRRSVQHVRELHDFMGALGAGIAPRTMSGMSPGLAVIAYTSGTTGKPKGAMLNHRAFVHAITQRSLWFSDTPDQTELLTLPVSHLAGMNVMNQSLRMGRTIVLLARWNAATAAILIEHHRIASWAAVTPMIIDLLAHPEVRRRDLSSLKRLYGGATAMPQAVAQEIEQRLGIRFIESYGMTEVCGGTHINPLHAPRRQCAGIPCINVDSRVIDPDTGKEFGANQTGEIIIHTPAQFDGYWNQPATTRETLIEIDGKLFVRSGDIGHYDDDGYFYVTDRLKRMINASGLKVWPAEIEAWLYGHPDVQEVCVISARDRHRGETVKALIVLRPSDRETTPTDLMEWARTRMAAYKVPRLIEFVDVLPKTNTGKVLWRELQARQDMADNALDADSAARLPTIEV
jgi:fatty-acyl-CoA synthase